jgi:hypothetical protein
LNLIIPIGSTSYYFMILSSCISITLHVEHDTDDELVINDDVALAEMENTIEKKKTNGNDWT